MKFLVQVDTNHDAFEGAAGRELARILRDIADTIEEEPDACSRNFRNVQDINGNIVGTFALKSDAYKLKLISE